jgi:hypothetical protein
MRGERQPTNKVAETAGHTFHFQNNQQGRETSLYRQSAGAQYSRRDDILPAKLADDRVHGSRWSRRQI